MILIECPSCDGPMATDLPLPDELTCDACAVTWDVVDPAPTEALLAA